MIQKNTEQILINLNAAIHSKKLYPPGHPSASAPGMKTHTLVTGYLAEKAKLTLAIIGDDIVMDELPVENSLERYGEIVGHLKALDIEAVTFERGVTRD
ncbi:MAG: hypothetical protein HY890_04860, partial [Deltaproteobacteria bacterium]|nr:hypothetical protein [Deltaproteobacteria bacterium]